MEIKVYGEKEKKKVGPVYLRLVSCGGGIELVACNKVGERLNQGKLLRLNPGGNKAKIYLYADVNPNLGFELDGVGYIIIELEE